MSDSKNADAATSAENPKGTSIRLVITTEVANAEEEERVRQWINEFVDRAKGSFPLKDKVQAVAERIVSEPKDNWQGLE